MQSVWRMVLVRIFLSASFAASRGTSGFSIKLSVGVLWTGTRRCISTLAAAEEAIGLTGCGSSRGPPSLESPPGWETTGSGPGITMASPQEGQLISYAVFCLKKKNYSSLLGQLKMTSIHG